MIIRKMQVEERTERLPATTFELRQVNAHGPDDRMTVAFESAFVPGWKVGQYVMVEIKGEGE